MNTRLMEEAQVLMEEAEAARQLWAASANPSEAYLLEEDFNAKFAVASKAVREATEADPDPE